MKISYNWLKDYIHFHMSPTELGDLFDQLGLAVDGIAEIGAAWSNVVVGRVVACEPVPKSKHLSRCEVDIKGEGYLNILCGAPNVKSGLTVAVAVVGAKLSDGMKITRRKIFGIESEGMICSEAELGLSKEAAGIMELPQDLPLGTAIEEHFGKRDSVFDLEVTFNRPDWLSHIGVAREISAATGLPFHLPEIELVQSNIPSSDKVSVEIIDSKKCPRYAAMILEGLKVAPSPLWMQDRLRAVGVRPINNIVDVTNYVLMETGHPLHAFDSHLIKDGKIIVRPAEKNEKFITLDEKEHALTENDLLISDPEKAIALAGVMGGMNSEITPDTSDVLLECACFEPTSIRITSRDRAIRTESSHRFERGVDIENVPFVINRAASLLCSLAGGQVLRGIVDKRLQAPELNVIMLRPQRVNSVLATELSSKEISGYLTSLHCAVVDGEVLEVKPPPWRGDLIREIDLIEEVARMYGYNNIETARISSVPLTPEPSAGRKAKQVNHLKQSLVELGFHESISFSLVPGRDSEKIPTDGDPLKLINPLSDDMAQLRSSLLPSLLRVAERNHNAGLHDLRLFEWSVTFSRKGGKIVESAQLSGIISGNSNPGFWRDDIAEIDFFDLKGLMNQFAVKNSLDNFGFIYYHIAEYFEIGCKMIAGNGRREIEVGIFGKIDSDVAKSYNLDFPVWYFEFDGDVLLSLSGKTKDIKDLPRYPAALRDLAFIVDESVSVGSLELVITQNGGDLLKNVEFFDLFRGSPVENDKKSLAYHLIFRDNRRTLSDAEVDKRIARIISQARDGLGAVLRTG